MSIYDINNQIEEPGEEDPDKVETEEEKEEEADDEEEESLEPAIKDPHDFNPQFVGDTPS